MTNEREYVDLLQAIIDMTGAKMPEGYNSWGIKSVHPDLMTTHGFRWAFPGGWNVSNDKLARGNRSACPDEPGDGLCVATSWRGMASSGIPARTLLLVAYREEDIIGRDTLRDKLRIGGAVASVALVDGERLVSEHGHGADLQYANLRGMDFQQISLRGANLQYANLQGVNLLDANLQGANLHYADLKSANLKSANLLDANLQGANLRYANLKSANLKSANLLDANLLDANLKGANLLDANLKGAKLQGANLRDVSLRFADLHGVNLRDVYIGDATPPGWTNVDGLLEPENE